MNIKIHMEKKKTSETKKKNGSVHGCVIQKADAFRSLLID